MGDADGETTTSPSSSNSWIVPSAQLVFSCLVLTHTGYVWLSGLLGFATKGQSKGLTQRTRSSTLSNMSRPCPSVSIEADAAHVRELALLSTPLRIRQSCKTGEKGKTCLFRLL